MTHLQYRPEIDGLRAIAVGLVVLYHAKVFGVAAGFLGVDVFFVISGYLITQIISRDLERNKFRISEFLERRARRILPALFVVILFCVPLSFFLMVPYQLVDFGKSVVATVTFISNVLFWRESSYFAQAADLKPLLHTWSLAIEEQFYLIFPWILLLFAKRPYSRIICFCTAIGASVFLAQWMSLHSIIVANFFLLPSRVFELLVGALAAYLQSQFAKLENKTALAGCAAGLLAIVIPAFAFSAATPHPSAWTLIPVLGTALVLLLTRPNNLLYHCLALRPVVGLGAISYSLYLWHHPLFAFAQLKGLNTKAWPVALLLIGIALICSYLSWRFVENPIRNRTRLQSQKHFFCTIAVAAGVFVIFGTATIFTSGFIQRFDKEDWPILNINATVLGRYTERAFHEFRDHEFDDGLAKQKWLILGDSYAQDFVNMIAENNLLDVVQIRTFSVAVRCPKYIGVRNIADLYLEHKEFYDKAYCENFSNLAHAAELVKKADLVVLANHWRSWEAEMINETIHNLRSRPDQRFLILGTKDFGDILPMEYLDKSHEQRVNHRNTVLPSIVEVNKILRKTVRPEDFIDIQKLLCHEDLACPIFTPDGELTSFDGHHFTPAGAKHVGLILFANDPLKSAIGP